VREDGGWVWSDGSGLGEQLQKGAPAATIGDAVAECLAVDDPLDVPVLELDGGLVGAVGGEADLDLAGVGGVGVELPTLRPCKGYPGH
jgi:hypothetical protein